MIGLTKNCRSMLSCHENSSISKMNKSAPISVRFSLKHVERGVSRREKGIRVNGPCCLLERKSSRTVCKGYTLLVILWVIGWFFKGDLKMVCYCFSMKKKLTLLITWYGTLGNILFPFYALALS